MTAPLFNWELIEGLSVNVWEYNKDHPDTVVISWQLVGLGEVRVRQSTQQANDLLVQLEEHFKDKEASSE